VAAQLSQLLSGGQGKGGGGRRGKRGERGEFCQEHARLYVGGLNTYHFFRQPFQCSSIGCGIVAWGRTHMAQSFSTEGIILIDSHNK